MANQSGAVTERVMWSRPLDHQLQPMMYTGFLTNNGMAMRFFGSRASSYVVRSLSATGLDIVDYDKNAQNSFQYDQRPDLPSEEFDMTQNKSVSIRIDRQDQVYGDPQLTAEVMLAKFMAERFAPYRDRYVLQEIFNRRKTGTTLVRASTAALDKDDIYEDIVKAKAAFENYVVNSNDDNPYALGQNNMQNVALVLPVTRKAELELDDRYSRETELAQRSIVFQGRVGRVTGLPVYGIPDTYFSGINSGKINYFMVATDIVAAPFHIEYTKIHTIPTNFQGQLVQMRTIWDAHITEYGRQKILVSTYP